MAIIDYLTVLSSVLAANNGNSGLKSGHCLKKVFQTFRFAYLDNIANER